jgi:NADH-ubiquinone oxidoreductase chain 6
MKNPIISVLFLIGLFLSIAGYLMILGINFIGLSYLLVYVGAVSILFLFILMLINVRVSELVSDNSNSVPLGITISILFNAIFYNILPYNSTNYQISKYLYYLNTVELKNNTINNNLFNNAGDLSLVTSHIWDGSLAETSHITSIGSIMYTNYPIWLILTSLILLLAMVGAIIITIKQ